MNQNNVLNDNQHGFREHHSCVTQLLALTEDLSFALDNQKQIDIILLDFSKAFDSVPHQRFLNKLRYYGINNIYQWIKAWLTQRSQQVVLDDISSDSIQVQSGVPQAGAYLDLI